MIKSIKLKRFKQFKETKIELRPFSILMGENNSGKTSVLQAIWLALFGLHQGKLLTFDAKTMRVKGSNTGYYMFEVPFAPKEDLTSLFYNKVSREGSSWDENSGAILQIVDEYDNCITLHLRDLFKNLNFKLLTPAEELRCPDIQLYEPLYISGFVGMYFQEERMFPATLEAKVSAGNVNSIIRNIILDLKIHSSNKFAYLNDLLSTEFGFHIKDIHFHEDDDLYVFSEYEEEVRRREVSLDFSSCGSGIMQILQIIAVILRYCPEKTKVVLIDEPDAHLHSNLQVKFTNILMKIQKEFGIQIIMSTHSTAIIQNVEPEDVIPILAYAPINKGLTCSDEVQKTIIDRLDAYELGKAKISGKIAFFEDSNLEIFEKMADVLHIDSFSGVNTIPMICGRGKDDKLPFSINTLLYELLGRNIEIHVIRDSDGMPDDIKQKLVEFATNHGVKLHILSLYEIENYVLNAELFFRTLKLEPKNAGKQIPTIEEIQEKIYDALRETIRGGIYKYNSTLSDVLYKVKHNLLGENDYKTDDASHETDRIYKDYYDMQNAEDLQNIGMGKQARTIVLSWLNNEKGLVISKKGMLFNLNPEDVCNEIRELLLELKSDLEPYTVVEKEVTSRGQKEEYEQLSFMNIENFMI